MNIEHFKTLNEFQQKRILALAEQAEEDLSAKSKVLKCNGGFEKNHSVVFIACDIAVIENDINPTFPEARFTFAVLKEKGWEGRSNYFSNQENAYLGALGYKHHGANSQFALFTTKMLQS